MSKLKRAADGLDITEVQLKGLLSMLPNPVYDCMPSREDVRVLQNKKYIDASGISQRAQDKLKVALPELFPTVAKRKVKANKEPNITKEQKAIIQQIGNSLIPQNISKFRQDVIKKDLHDLSKKLENDKMASYYYIWMSCFPSKSREANIPWEQFFNVKYNGVPLRFMGRCTEQFKSLYLHKNIGIVILATVKFINDHIDRANKATYIPKVTNFLKTLDTYYAEVEALWEEGRVNEILNIESGQHNMDVI